MKDKDIHYYFISKEIIIIKKIKALNLAKVVFADGIDAFYVDLNFIDNEKIKSESSLSLNVLGGVK